MLEDKITIGGKEVGVVFCLGTEIAFEALSGKPLSEVDWTRNEGLSQLVVDLIIACAYSYYDARHEDMPIEDRDILYHATREEIEAATTAVIALLVEWSTDPSEKEEAPQTGGAQEGDRASD